MYLLLTEKKTTEGGARWRLEDRILLLCVFNISYLDREVEQAVRFTSVCSEKVLALHNHLDFVK